MADPSSTTSEPGGSDVTFSLPELDDFPDTPSLYLPAPTLHSMPPHVKTPVATYYAPIRWAFGFENWNVVRFSTPMDGSCLFHAIANSFFDPYHKEEMNGRHVSRVKMVEVLRRELAAKLGQKVDPNDPQSPTHYDTLNHGHTAEFGTGAQIEEFKLSYMQSQLDSTLPIGYGYMEFIGNALNKDIYILSAATRDIYVTDELPLTIKGDRSSVVLYYMNAHYELVGIQQSDGTFVTHFAPDHSFIRFLHARVLELLQA
jgi:hypothetical protein